MATSFTKRPRNVGVLQAIAILYGDWGTSKAYVIGLAFAIAGYSSFWLIAAVSVLIVLVGTSYITICKYNPTGGGVYASVRKRSEILSLVGAFFLIADYLITASLSALASFEYLGMINPQYGAIAAVLAVGAFNYFGPKHSGNLAFVIAVPTFLVVLLLALSAVPYYGTAIHSLQPLKGGWFENWIGFVGIIVALSGVESIANNTGIMKLDPGSTDENPSVHQTSKKAIFWVMVEVSVFTALLGLAMTAVPGLQVSRGEVLASDHSMIRDYMLRYMGDFFVSAEFGAVSGHIFATIVSIVFGILLLSAVNTAIVSLVSLVFVMSRDGELPPIFQKMNRFGVPVTALIVSTVVPAIILIFVHDVASLAELYAVGFVGAIATNLGTTSLDQSLPLRRKERFFMFGTFLLMAMIELTLLVYKPDARRFVFSIITVGLILRSLVLEQRQKVWETKQVKLQHASLFTEDTLTPLHEGAILCPVNSIGKTLDFALEEAKQTAQRLYILFIREQKVITEEDRHRVWLDDAEACEIFDYAKDSSHDIEIKFFYYISDDPPQTILRVANKLNVSRLILGRSRRSAVVQLLRGNLIQEVSDKLPPAIDLLVIS